MWAGIISVGDEILWGQVQDRNFPFLARRLGLLGIAVEGQLTVGDDRERLAEEITRMCGRFELVLMSGGLGPTEDDVTRYALADALAEQLELDQQALEQIKDHFGVLKRDMGAVNRIQAMIPSSGRAIENSCGTAPGIAARLGKAQIFALPGVPHEMRAMFDRSVEPELDRLGLGGLAIVSRSLHCCGAGESDIFSRIKELMSRPANPQVGMTVSDGIISVSITARAASAAEAEVMAEQKVQEIASRLGKDLFARGEQTLGQVVGGLLLGSKQSLAVAESCTGGLIGKLLTDRPGASEFFVADIVSYSNGAKVGLLGVGGEVLDGYGAVSEQCARAMACGALTRSGADWGLSVTGIAGPQGGSKAKPVGLIYIGLARKGANGQAGAVGVREWLFCGNRSHIRVRASVAALDMLRRALLADKGI